MHARLHVVFRADRFQGVRRERLDGAAAARRGSLSRRRSDGDTRTQSIASPSSRPWPSRGRRPRSSTASGEAGCGRFGLRAPRPARASDGTPHLDPVAELREALAKIASRSTLQIGQGDAAPRGLLQHRPLRQMWRPDEVGAEVRHLPAAGARSRLRRPPSEIHCGRPAPQLQRAAYAPKRTAEHRRAWSVPCCADCHHTICALGR
jgi:hypothetical protein